MLDYAEEGAFHQVQLRLMSLLVFAQQMFVHAESLYLWSYVLHLIAGNTHFDAHETVVHNKMEVVNTSRTADLQSTKGSCRNVPSLLLGSLVEEPKKGIYVPNHLLESSKCLADGTFSSKQIVDYSLVGITCPK